MQKETVKSTIQMSLESCRIDAGGDIRSIGNIENRSQRVAILSKGRRNGEIVTVARSGVNAPLRTS